MIILTKELISSYSTSKYSQTDVIKNIKESKNYNKNSIYEIQECEKYPFYNVYLVTLID